jgi:hypothetical protein
VRSRWRGKTVVGLDDTGARVGEEVEVVKYSRGIGVDGDSAKTTHRAISSSRMTVHL